MSEKYIVSLCLGIIGAGWSYLIFLTDLDIFSGNIYSYILLPLYIAIVLFLVFFKKPNAIELGLRIIIFFIGYILLIKTRIDHINIVGDFATFYPEMSVSIIINLVVIIATFFIASLVRIVLGRKKK